MKRLGKIGALAAAGTLFASSAFAATLTIMTTDLESGTQKGDGVNFMITNTGGEGQFACGKNGAENTAPGTDCLKSLTIDISDVPGVNTTGDMALFNLNKKMDLGKPLIIGSNTVGATSKHQNNVWFGFADDGKSLTMNFREGVFSADNRSLSFDTWILQTIGSAPWGGFNGLTELASVTAMWQDGSMATGNFVLDDSGKGTLVFENGTLSDGGGVNPIPLPASAVLLLAGLAGLGVARRKS